jgi:hypothetical protein
MAKRNQQRKRMAAVRQKAHDNNPHTHTKTGEDCKLGDITSRSSFTLNNTTYNLIQSSVRCGGNSFPPGNNCGDILAKNLGIAYKNLLRDPTCNATTLGRIIKEKLFVECFWVSDPSVDSYCAEENTDLYPLAKLIAEKSAPGAANNRCIHQYLLDNPSLKYENINQYAQEKALLTVLEVFGAAAGAGVGVGMIVLVSCLIFILCLAGPKTDRMLEKSRKTEEAESLTGTPNNVNYGGDNTEDADNAEDSYNRL